MLFFIHGTGDTYIPHVNMDLLAAAARTAPNASVQTWLVPGAEHAQAFNTRIQEYVERVIAFYTNVLGPDTNLQSS